MSREELIQLIKSFPEKPGVYLMYDIDEKVIYVGKAKKLRRRVLSYFRHSNFSSPRLKKLVETINDISTIRTESEIEALILENRLIKLYQPFFNVDLKMNERYAYIKLTQDKFPRLVVTRQKINDNAIYLGPYVRVSEIRELLRLIERYLPLRSCSQNIDKQNKTRPCMRYSLGRCLAPCAKKCDENEYKDRVADVLMLLNGNSLELIEKLRNKMDFAARKLEFEESAKIRDTMRAIWRVSRQRNNIPDIPYGKDDYWETLNSIQKLFKTDILPWRIDGFDISHTSGENTVGVVVVFEQGYPNTGLYRRFNIKTVDGIDDFRSIKETVLRRYSRSLKGQEPLPQLILIDGGPVQLEFAIEALNELNIKNIPVFSLAEEFEEIYLPNKREPIVLEKTDPVLKLFQQVRDEAHRFAITSHRNLREKKFKRSALEEIPGIGKKKAAQLITTFGSLKNILNISLEELSKTPGIGEKLAKKIHEKLSIRASDEAPEEN
ncbi:MAG: excinuclease ABC subunit UvrC [Synergistaceae bacterium]